jgi:hypothetical protein
VYVSKTPFEPIWRTLVRELFAEIGLKTELKDDATTYDVMMWLRSQVHKPMLQQVAAIIIDDVATKTFPEALQFLDRAWRHPDMFRWQPLRLLIIDGLMSKEMSRAPDRPQAGEFQLPSLTRMEVARMGAAYALTDSAVADAWEHSRGYAKSTHERLHQQWLESKP